MIKTQFYSLERLLRRVGTIILRSAPSSLLSMQNETRARNLMKPATSVWPSHFNDLQVHTQCQSQSQSLNKSRPKLASLPLAFPRIALLKQLLRRQWRRRSHVVWNPKQPMTIRSLLLKTRAHWPLSAVYLDTTQAFQVAMEQLWLTLWSHSSKSTRRKNILIRETLNL